MKHNPHALVAADLVGTPDADTFLFHASAGSGLQTVSGFDAAQDRVLLDFDHSYSDIMSLDKPYDGMVTNTVNGGHVEFHTVAGGTEIDAYGSTGELHILLAGVDVDSLWGWNIAGG